MDHPLSLKQSGSARVLSRGCVTGNVARPWFIAVGASGRSGISDLKALLAALSPELDAVVLVVLHRPFDRPSHLHDILAKVSRIPIVVARKGERFEPGTCYIGKPAAHLALAASTFGDLVADPRATYRNRTVDLLFRSISANAGTCAIGVVLSGSLDDGSRGLAAIHEAGGKTMVLSPRVPAECGMPENAIRYDGPIDFIGTPEQIAGEICRLVHGSDAAGQANRA